MLISSAIAAALFTGASLAQDKGAQTQALLPDGEVSRSGAYSAWLIDPVTRYDHGVLGDSIEAGGFAVERHGRRLVYRLPHDAVFEDRRVRLADLDGDGVPEAIIVKAYLQRGAALAVYRLLSDRIEPMAESAAIGTRNRWLNPVGVADFTGSGKPMIAVVLTPHLTGSLRLYSLNGETLGEVARIDGYTNHIIGRRDLDLARIVKTSRNQTPVIIIPTLDRRRLAAVSFKGAAPALIKSWSLETTIERLQVDDRSTAKVFTPSGVREIDLREPAPNPQ